ncbi:hypothetical protein Plim_2960 [Planctopirus limnophila DSM 3776]|uniref:Uncharacterized protein n=1 Tax=Planctopirus limnophila (strain ATCC 43296 / DSM 3776 / IFAM 1008 / Mu 290) TaxID=521674 RepID=D5SS58_PLAL2|nr:hypothetical protein [Planctopirus limnophila]ADG68782.1 hypothetical protein Plim_2960 [Planctopirus limnophila DSM 3776]
MLHDDHWAARHSRWFRTQVNFFVLMGMMISCTSGCGGGATQIPTVRRIAEDVIPPPAEVAAPVIATSPQPANAASANEQSTSTKAADSSE